MSYLHTRGLLLVCAAVYGCTTTRPAPVVERTPYPKPAAAAASTIKPTPRAPDSRPERYTVKPGDTLYSIALEQGVDPRDLAQWNAIDNPSALRTGQQLRVLPPAADATVAASGVVATPLKGASGAIETKPLGTGPATTSSVAAATASSKSSAPIVSEPKAIRLPYSEQAYAQLSAREASVLTPSNEKPAAAEAHPPVIARQTTPRDAPSAVQPPEKAAAPDARATPARPSNARDWMWPANGKVISTFESSNKGIDIAGKLGQPIFASAPGKVIFSGTMRGLGKVIVLEHADDLISVYAHNHELVVKQGQTVTRGQKIAEMGSSESDQAKLHFEIRRRGNPNPIDPLKILPEQS